MPSLGLSLTPILFLLTALVVVIATIGPGAVQQYSYIILLSAAALTLALSYRFARRTRADLVEGFRRSARQILPAIPILALIGTLSATWMLSGVVPYLIYHGLEFLNPRLFLLTACLVCSVVSVVTGSSWTTIATIGLAFMGIGQVMGFSPGWIAGAVISGAYFGDKISPLSDTTVLAASSTDVPLFTHIRFMMLSTLPALIIALIVYTAVGFTTDVTSEATAENMEEALAATFNLTHWVVAVPLLTVVMIALRLPTWITLSAGSLAGLIAIFVFQPDIAASLSWYRILLSDTALATGSATLDPLVATGGVAGMIPTVILIASALVFGGALLGTGMLRSIAVAFTSRLSRPRNLVGATVGSGLFLNCFTGDQYLSIIIGGNIFRRIYRDNGLRPQVLSRALEDSISVTSVLIPWNSCGITQSTVLGVATLTYLPFCIFNYVSPLMSIILAWAGFRLHAPSPALTPVQAGAEA